MSSKSMKFSTEQSDDSLTITVSGLQFNVLMAVANAVRRTLLSDIPVIGMDTVDITTNTMLLHHNQEITHKLTSIPVISCETFKNGMVEPLTASFNITATDMKKVFSSDDIVTPTVLKLHRGIPIVTMLPGEMLTGTITFGVSTASVNALKYGAIVVPEYQIVQNPTRIVMVVTPKSHYSTTELIDTCRELLLKDIDTIYSAVTSNDSDTVTINSVESGNSDTSLVQFFINGYDHTIGNMISTIINTEMDVKFAGYCKPHPSNELIMVSIRSVSPIDDFKNALLLLRELVNKITVD